MRRTLTLTLLTICSWAYSQAISSYLNPCPYIHALINLQSGEPNLSQTDLTVSGVAPISINRAYLKTEHGVRSICRWEIEANRIWVWTKKKRCDVGVTLQIATGRILPCQKPLEWFEHHDKEPWWSANLALHDTHNLVDGRLSAQTDLANVSLRHRRHVDGMMFYYQDGSGEKLGGPVSI